MAATTTSYPPVASSATNWGPRVASRRTRSARPDSSRVTGRLDIHIEAVLGYVDADEEWRHPLAPVILRSRGLVVKARVQWGEGGFEGAGSAGGDPVGARR